MTDTNRSVVADILTSLKSRGRSAAVIEIREGRPITTSAASLAHDIEQTAAGLAAAGVGPGDTVALIGANSGPWITLFLATIMTGAVPAPVDAATGEKEFASILGADEPKLVFCDRATAPAVAASANLGGRIYLLDRPEDKNAGGWPDWRALQRQSAPPEIRSDGAQPVVLMRTSGTTGPAKRFTLDDGNIRTNIDALLAIGALRADDVVLLPLPLHHIYPLVVGLLTPLSAGAAVALPDSISARDLQAAFAHARPTVMLGVPRLYEALLDSLSVRIRQKGSGAASLIRLAMDACSWLSSRLSIEWPARALFAPIRKAFGGRLRLLVSGGARLEPETARRLAGLGFAVLSGYGLAETASVFTGNTPRASRPESQGRPLGDGEIRIDQPDENGNGEVLLRGRNVFSGYADPQATKKAFTDDGWFRTGDLGHLDSDGFLYVVGRANELIVLSGGKKLFPEELEQKYAQSRFVREIGILARDRGLAALIVPDIAAMQSDGLFDLRSALRVELAEIGQTLAPHLRLTGFATTNEPLPRTRLGKLRRFLLPDLYRRADTGAAAPAATADETAATSDDPMERTLLAVLHRRYPGRPLSLDANPMLDLGIDSLEAMSLALDLEQALGVEIREEQILASLSVRDIAAAIRGARSASPGASTHGHALAPSPRPASALGKAILTVMRTILRLLYRIETTGQNNIPPNGPIILAPNHTSYLDPGAIAVALPRPLLWKTRWAGDAHLLFRSPARRLLSRSVGIFPIDMRDPGRAVATARAVLREHGVLVWFPEGWRSPTGALGALQPGLGRVAEGFDVTIVPVLIEGTFDAWPRSRRWPRLFRRLRVTFGAGWKAGTSPPKDAAAITGELQRLMLDMTKPSSAQHRTAPPSQPSIR